MTKEINEHNFRPLRGLVLVRRDRPEEEKGGIAIPDAWQQYGWRAEVIKSGPKAQDFQRGEGILFLKEYTVLPFKNRRLALTDAKHILAKLIVEAGIELIIPQNNFVLVEPHPAASMNHGVYFPDKSKKQPRSGWVIRYGLDCKNMMRQRTVWYEANTGVNCVECGTRHVLLKEENIMAIQAGI